MAERLKVHERASRGPEVVQEEIFAHLERVGHRINQELLETLVGEVTLSDLRDDPLSREIGRVPLAKIEDTTITLDHGFLELSPQQQQHVLFHEYSHTIARLLESHPTNHLATRLHERLGAIDGIRISPYIAYLETTLPENEEKAWRMQDERCAEAIAQYLEGDRTFTGFMKAKLLEFDASDTPELLTHYREIIEKIHDLGGYLDLVESESDREAFLDTHPLLREQYELWQEIDLIFQEVRWEELAELDDEGEEAIWDDYVLGDQMSPEITPPDIHPRTVFSNHQLDQPPPSPFADLITFWRIFA